MPDVQTVQGAVDADELGTVLAHEHVRFRDEAVAAEWPTRYDEGAELDAALEAERDPARRAKLVNDHNAKLRRLNIRYRQTAQRRA